MVNSQTTIAAANRKGLYWGTRTLLQLAEQSQTRA
ncbi:MAG: glycoside hydrolase family 20 zincin-like fold domain-containing protein, partial [Corynebacterium matruchotii]